VPPGPARELKGDDALRIDRDPHLHGAVLDAGRWAEGSMAIVSVALRADEHHRACKDALAPQPRGIVGLRDDLDSRLAVDNRRLLVRVGNCRGRASAISSVGSYTR
jgi:hypothetical protein